MEGGGLGKKDKRREHQERGRAKSAQKGERFKKKIQICPLWTAGEMGGVESQQRRIKNTNNGGRRREGRKLTNERDGQGKS